MKQTSTTLRKWEKRSVFFRQLFLPGRTLHIALLTLVASACARAEGTGSPTLFDGPASEYATTAGVREPGGNPILRVLHVEERAGVSRTQDLVRVPLFFAEGECPSLDNIAILPEASEMSHLADIPWQADDIRRGPDGGIARVHLWFPVDLKAGEKRRFRLIRRTDKTTHTAFSAAIAVDGNANELRVSTASGRFVWSKTGELRSLPIDGVNWSFDSSGAFPRVLIKFSAANEQPALDVALDRTTPGREVTWSSGPLFARIRVRIAGEHGVALEQDYRIPRHGREIVLSSTLFPGERSGGVVREHRLLQGSTVQAAASRPTLQRVPAGIRYSLRNEHAYAVTVLQSSVPGGILAVPLIIGGSNGTWSVEEDGSVSLNGHRGLQRGKDEKDTLKAFWTEVRLVPVSDTGRDALWESYRRHVQPLVAIVEEPGATVEKLHAALRDVVREMKPIGWRQEAGRALVMGDVERVARILKGNPSPRDQDREGLLRGARNSRAKLTNNGARKLREDEKGRAYGSLDPYHITYTQSAAAALAVLGNAPPSVNAVNALMAGAIREEGGRVDSAGYPYIDCFNRTLNMQLGPVLFGLTAGAATGETKMVQFYRDLATAPPVQSIFGRGQRPYTGASATKADQTDYLYQAICDFWLRATEVLGNEDLSLHPLAYSRYTDCIDVMADQYHGVAASDKPGTAGQARANFFRGQAHTHRWLGWSCAPYIRLIEDPAEKGAVGLTEAIHHSNTMKGRWKNWPDLTYYILADLLVREGLDRTEKPTLPAAPSGLLTRKADGKTELSWKPVEGAKQYRVYRTEQPGGPYRWLNSPHLESSRPSTTETVFVDSAPGAKSSYVITAVNDEGRESAWDDSHANQKK
jgi:hypothetical protein